jgi:hypothetical protein
MVFIGVVCTAILSIALCAPRPRPARRLNAHAAA